MTGVALRKFRTAQRALTPGAYGVLRAPAHNEPSEPAGAPAPPPEHQYTREEFAAAKARYRAREDKAVAHVHALIKRVESMIQKIQKLPATKKIPTHLLSSQYH